MNNLVVYTLKIDENNKNCKDACTYLDDASNLNKGSIDWDNMPIFKDIRPCVFKNGQVNYYLNPNNWNEKLLSNEQSKLDGTDGDVMIEFKKFAYAIYRENNQLYISITNNDEIVQQDNRYTYAAFCRFIPGDIEYFYEGAFQGWIDNNGYLRSIIGKEPTRNKTINDFKQAAELHNTNTSLYYHQFGWYHLIALQCLYLIRYGNRNGQEECGSGITNVLTNTPYLTGYNTNNLTTLLDGMYTDIAHNNKQTDGLHHMRCFGIEDWWGNLNTWIEGLYTNESWDLITKYNALTNSESIKTNHARDLDLSTWIKTVYGTNDAGFIITSGKGSNDTYWADLGYLYANRIPYFGGKYDSKEKAGPFYLDIRISAEYISPDVGGRLSYT